MEEKKQERVKEKEVLLNDIRKLANQLSIPENDVEDFECRQIGLGSKMLQKVSFHFYYLIIFRIWVSFSIILVSRWTYKTWKGEKKNSSKINSRIKR